MLRKTLVGLAASLALAAGSASALAQGTAFTYQGQLKNSGSAVSTPTDMQFSLWTAAAGGSQVGSTVTQTNVTVTGGLFTSNVDFGVNPYTSNQNLYLQIAVRNPAGSGSYVPMGSRQLLTPSPFSLATRGISVDSGGLVGIGTTTPSATLSIQSGYNTPIDALTIHAGYAPDPGQYALGIRPYVVGGGNTGYGFTVKNGANFYTPLNLTRSGVSIGTYASQGTLTVAGPFGPWTAGNGFATFRDANDLGQVGLTIGADGGFPNEFAWIQARYANDNSQTKTLALNPTGGNVGIGTTTPGSRLHAVGTSMQFEPVNYSPSFTSSGSTRVYVGSDGAANSVASLFFRSAGNVRSGLENSSNGLTLLTATGTAPSESYTARMTLTPSGNIGIGTATPGYKLDVNGAAAVNNLTIKGGSDLVEGFDSQTTDIEPGTLMVIDPAHPGQLMPSTSAYDSKVAGIVSGAGGVNPGIKMGQDGVMDGKNPIAMTGRVYVKATTTGGKIQPGDLLTTSDVVGHAMRAGDENTNRGVIIGKAMSSLDEGTGLVLVLVNLQ